jgi:uncharacterized protein YggE
MKTIVLLLSLLPSVLLSQDLKNENLVTVIGFSESEVEPDWVTITMNTQETENVKKESEIVKAENELLSFFTSLGIDSKDFIISNYSASTSALTASTKYRLSKSYELKLRDISLLDTIIDKCFESEMNNIMISEVGHSEIKMLQEKSLILAIQDAKRKAEILASELGFKLGKVFSVNERYSIVGNQSYNNNIGFYGLEEVVVRGYGSGVSSRIGSSLTLNKIKLSKTVIVQYEME